MVVSFQVKVTSFHKKSRFVPRNSQFVPQSTKVLQSFFFFFFFFSKSGESGSRCSIVFLSKNVIIRILYQLIARARRLGRRICFRLISRSAAVARLEISCIIRLRLFMLWNELTNAWYETTFLWNEVSIAWNETTFLWNKLTSNETTVITFV